MARPRDNEYRTAILNALDMKFACSINDVNEYLKESNKFKSYASTRRMLLKMVSEGVINIHPKRHDKNAMYFMKGTVSPFVKMSSFNGDVVNISDFINSTYDLELDSFLNESVATGIKSLMFDYLVATRPDLFVGIRDIPDRKEIRRKLEKTLEYTQTLHRFIKSFLTADIHSPVARKNIARELETVCTDKQVEIIVREMWKK